MLSVSIASCEPGFDICLRCFCVDSSSPHISAILVGHLAGKTEQSPQKQLRITSIRTAWEKLTKLRKSSNCSVTTAQKLRNNCAKAPFVRTAQKLRKNYMHNCFVRTAQKQTHSDRSEYFETEGTPFN